jgi:sodium-dependent dicarboxylate transporter 2/3/5
MNSSGDEGQAGVSVSADDAPQETTLRNTIGLWLGPILFLWMMYSPTLDALILPNHDLWFFPNFDAENPSVQAMAAIAALMAIWWMTEAIPIPATALLPLVLFPMFGIMPGDSRRHLGEMVPGIAKEYMSYYIFLFLGGFLIAIAVEKWNLHKRIALHILKIVGGNPRRLVLGFMIATALLSMWLSNTATTMMMMPMALSLVVLHENLNDERAARGESVDRRSGNFGFVLMLGLAYSASIGGVSTLIGTPPNMAFMGVIGQTYGGENPITFANWLAFAFPFSVTFLIIAWILLTRFIYPLAADSPFSGKDFIRNEIKKLGSISNEEIKVGCVFATAALLWMTRKNIVLGQGEDPFTIYGWSYGLDRMLEGFSMAPRAWMIDDSTVAITMALLLFMLPASRSTGGRLLDWQAARKVPWGILLLFGGGLALAKGFGVSGLSAWIGGELEAHLAELSPLGMIASIIVIVAGLTEFTSNLATANMTLPIVAEISNRMAVNPLMLMIPGALAASCAFILPVSTPPNAIVYGSGRVPIMKMVMAGMVMNITAFLMITLAIFTMGILVFDTLGPVPPWATEGITGD